jgi:hypothetical protein
MNASGAAVREIRLGIAALHASEGQTCRRWGTDEFAIRLSGYRTSGGEGGIRTQNSLCSSVSYRLYVAKDAKFATHAVAHCPVLPDGFFGPNFN